MTAAIPSNLPFDFFGLSMGFAGTAFGAMLGGAALGMAFFSIALSGNCSTGAGLSATGTDLMRVLSPAGGAGADGLVVIAGG